MRVAAIVNPVSGRKTARRQWPALLASLGSAAAGVETFWSHYRGHTELLAASARRSGYDRVIAVGGDGTLFDVLNGLWWEKTGGLPSVGMVPFGTGCDYIRNFEAGPSRVERLIAALSPSTVRVSLGRCLVQARGRPVERVFAMVLGLGIDAEVIRYFRTGRFGRAGWPAYAVSALKAFRCLKSHTLSGNLDGSPFHAGAIFFGAALGCCFGKRIVIAPGVSPAQNKLGLVWAGPAGFAGVLHMVFLAYFGALHRSPLVKSARASRLSIDSIPPAWIEADGELIGKTPTRIEIMPGAFAFAARAVKNTAGPSLSSNRKYS
ncbi:MAG: diacylglycerol kinase family protein [Syntrophobacteraceae bacterium]|jgi:diacylglycerol kinase family enzyme